MCHYMKRKPYRSYGKIGVCIWKNVSASLGTADNYDLASEGVNQYPGQYSQDQHCGYPGIYVLLGLFHLSRALIQAEVCCSSDPHQHAHGGGKSHGWKSHVCCSISQHSHHVTDEDLVRYVICCAHQHAYDRRYGKPGYQRKKRRRAKRVL